MSTKAALMEKVRLIREKNTAILPTGEIVAPVGCAAPPCSPVPLSALDVEMWTMDALRNLPIGVTTKDGKKWKAVIMFIPENAGILAHADENPSNQ